jgi:signal transduction histidine kinase
MREFYRRRDDRDSHLPVNLNRIATQVIDLTRPRWRDIPQARGIMIELRTEFEDGLPQVAASESELREAITNLLLNAIDAMPKGGEIVIRSVTRAWIADSRRKAQAFPRFHGSA